jgi:hypothetical protein
MSYGVPPETQRFRFSGKANGINANCGIHLDFRGL